MYVPMPAPACVCSCERAPVRSDIFLAVRCVCRSVHSLCAAPQFDVELIDVPSAATNTSLRVFQFIHPANQEDYEMTKDKTLIRRAFPVTRTKARRKYSPEETAALHSAIGALCEATSNATGLPTESATFNPDVRRDFVCPAR
jgi:hypothetical protein